MLILVLCCRNEGVSLALKAGLVSTPRSVSPLEVDIYRLLFNRCSGHQVDTRTHARLEQLRIKCRQKSGY